MSDMLTAFPTIVLWCVAKSDRVTTSLPDSSEHINLCDS